MMKKQHYILFLIFLVQHSIYAQEYSSPTPAKKIENAKTTKKFKLGVNAGFNLSNISFKDNDTTYSNDFDSRPGAHFGIKIQYELDKYFSIRSGFDFKTRGYKIKSTANIGGNRTTESTFLYNVSYLDIPLTIQVNLTPDNPTRVFIKGGAYYAFAVDGNYRLRLADNNIQLPPNSSGELSFGEGIQSDQKRTDLGLIIGGGLKFNIVEVAAMWDIGLANISPISTNGAVTKNRLFRLSITIFIPEFKYTNSGK